MAEVSWNTEDPQLIMEGVPVFTRDGIPIPESGINFLVTTQDENGAERETTINLSQVLCGLELNKQANGSQSKAESFASLAVQCGLLTEEAVIERYTNLCTPRLVPKRRQLAGGGYDQSDAGIVRGEDGQPIMIFVNQAGQASNRMFNVVKAKNTKKGVATARANGDDRTPEQTLFMYSLAEEAGERGLTVFADRLMTAVQGSAKAGKADAIELIDEVTTAFEMQDQAKRNRQYFANRAQRQNTTTPASSTSAPAPVEEPF